MGLRHDYNAVLNYDQYERFPLIHFGYWHELLLKWQAEGYLSKDEVTNFYSDPVVGENLTRQLGFDLEFKSVINARVGLLPPFDSEVVKNLPDGSRHVRNRDGVIELEVPGAISIRSEIEHLLTDRMSYEKHYKHRLQWSDDRLPDNLLQNIQKCNEDEVNPNVISVGSMIGSVRNWLGVVGLSYMQIDDPELLKEIIDTNAALSLTGAKALLEAGLRPDCAHYWEDICFNHGPLIAPDFFVEYLSEHYRRMSDLLKSYGCNLISVDCDGKVDELIGLWLDCGVNVIFPFEIGTWSPDLVALKKKYGRELRVVGGMNKHVLEKDRAAVDKEIERLKEWVDLGGYIPCPDHRMTPDTKWDLVCYYTERARIEFNK